jgi:hypothetical protein
LIILCFSNFILVVNTKVAAKVLCSLSYAVVFLFYFPNQLMSLIPGFVYVVYFQVYIWWLLWHFLYLDCPRREWKRKTISLFLSLSLFLPQLLSSFLPSLHQFFLHFFLRLPVYLCIVPILHHYVHYLGLNTYVCLLIIMSVPLHNYTYKVCGCTYI